jgi:tetratricopeptide (TPR) repeat protein
LNLQPNNTDMHVVLGMALMTKGLLDEAIAQFSKALEIRPNYSNGHYNLAVALAEKGEIADAIAHYEKAIEAQPDLFQALANLAWIFASSSDTTIRNGPKAVELAEKANRLAGDTSPLVLRTLAAAYATNRSFDKAVETSWRALQSAQQERNSELAEAIRREMSLYEAGLSYRAP